MAGFFKTSKLKSVTGKRRSCYQCGLLKKCRSPKIKPIGKGEKGIVIIGDFPGKQEDRKNTPLTGRNAKRLRSVLSPLGISLERDCTVYNAVNCYPGEDPPTSIQIEACRKSVQKLYKEKKPRLVILMGDNAVASHWGHRWKGEIESVFGWRGWLIPDHHFNCWTAPVYSPNFINQDETDDVAFVIWKEDIKTALENLEKPLPEKIDEDSVEVIFEEREAISFLRGLIRNPTEYFCFDYETTGLKPHFPGHKIACVGIATEKHTGTAFMLTPKVSYLLKKILKNSSKKIAQNMKFEDTWSRFILGTKVNNWWFDPMLASHVLDNRPRITKLKFQAFVQFGVADYSSHIEPYLRSVDGTSNGFNTVFKAPRRDLLIYCALDALIEYRLARLQMDRINWNPSERDPNYGLYPRKYTEK